MLVHDGTGRHRGQRGKMAAFIEPRTKAPPDRAKEADSLPQGNVNEQDSLRSGGLGRACIAQRYPTYDRKRIDQCVDICKACMNGNTITCNTSCRLNGAS
jgi:hypothetical protein